MLTHELVIIINIALAVGVALIGGLVAHRLKQSPIIGYLLGGMLVGHFATGLIVEREQIKMLAEVGVIFLMFALGVEFSLKEIVRMKGPAIFGTVAQVALLIAGGWAFGKWCGWNNGQALFFGGMISISSTMVIIKTLMSRGETASRHGRLMLGMLIVQDLAVVFLILLLPKLAAPDSAENSVTLLEVLVVLLKAAGFVALTLVLGARVVPRFMSHVATLGSSELFLLTAVFLALGSAGASAWIGLSPALGAFLAGLMLTETEFEHRVIAELVPMRDLFATLFFVSMGLLVNVTYVVAHFPFVLGAALFIVFLKALVTLGVLLPFKLGGKTTTFAGLGMISIGEFSFVLAQAGLDAEAITPDIYNLIVAAALVTIFLTPGAFWVAPRFDKTMARVPLLKLFFAPRQLSQVDDETLNAPHAIVMGYGRVGWRVARGLRQAGIPVVVIEEDLHLVQELRRDRHDAIYGDASYPSVLEAAHPQNANVIVVTLPDFGATRVAVQNAHRANPNAVIIARASRPEHDARLREAGATTVVIPELAGAFMLLEETLLLLGVHDETVFTGLSSLSISQEDAARAGSTSAAGLSVEDVL
jgi:CPA2 family monovalent cation:H+ antiporter-2